MKQNSYPRPGILRTILYPNDFKRNVTSYHAMSILLKIKDRKVLPSWMLDPVACGEIRDATEPIISFEALMALRQLLDAQDLPSAQTAPIAGVSQAKGACDAQEPSRSPSPSDQSTLCQSSDLDTAPGRQTPGVP